MTSSDTNDAQILNDASGVVIRLAAKAQQQGRGGLAIECCGIANWLQSAAEGMLDAVEAMIWERVGPALFKGIAADDKGDEQLPQFFEGEPLDITGGVDPGTYVEQQRGGR